MMTRLLSAVFLATPVRAANETWPAWWPADRNHGLDARVGKWHVIVPPTEETTIGNKTLWSMCNAAGTPGKHFRECEKGCNSLGGTLVSVENRAQQRFLRHFVGEMATDVYLLIGAYQRTYQSSKKGWRWTAAANPDHSFSAWRGGYPADKGMCRMSQCTFINFRGSKRWIDTSCVLARSSRGDPCATGCVCEHTEMGGVSSAHYLKHRRELHETEHCRPIDIFWITVLSSCGALTVVAFVQSVLKARRRAKVLELMRVQPLPHLAEVTPMPVGVVEPVTAGRVGMPVVEAIAVPYEPYPEPYRPCN